MTSSVPLDEAAAALGELAGRIYGGETYPDIFEEICRAAVAVVPGCDHACITTIRGGQDPELAATTDEVAARVDRMEWETHEGPCYDAIMTQRFEWDPDITQGPTWPKLAERVLAETGVRGMVGYRIVVGSNKIGALNLFSDTAGALTQESADIGAILASFASVAVTANAQQEEATSLREGLASNREIGKAIGLLMATHGVTDAEAFGRLREASNQMNVRLAEIARRVVGDHNATAGSA
ncbi:MAG TPA: GAF and ANTAR domain-containing protein [Nocardioides sp.]|nr:GAF and ANTAR domain-containing protein [Nocardioides sp.]